MVLKTRLPARNLLFSPWSIPIALFAITLLSYGLRALSLGFYWDDWPYLWIFQRAGAAGISAAFAGDRPFLSFIYTLSLSAFGNSSQAWQIFGLVARWLCTLGFWWMLSLTWLRYTHQVTWAAFLFAVYPGFTQQWIVVIYGQDFILYAAVFFSIALTLWLARRSARLARGWLAAGTLLALALSAFCMFSTEYFFGLELLRPVLLWIVLNERAESDLPALPWRAKLRQSLPRTAAWWSPYLALMIVFVIWRGFIHTFPGKNLTALDEITRSPLVSLWGLGLTILEDLVEASLVAWGQTLQALNMFIETAPENGLRMLALILLTGLLASVYLSRLCQAPDPKPGSPTGGQLGGWAGPAVLTGLFAMLAAGWPFWITGLPMRMGFPQDRYSLALAAGVCLLMAGLVDWLSGQTMQRAKLVRGAILISLLVSLAAGFHFNLSQSYRQAWNEVRNLFWQLTWRAPEIKPGTFLMTDSLSLQYYEDDSLSAPLNWTYDPDGRQGEMKYFLFDLYVRKDTLRNFLPDTPVTKQFRTNVFEGNTSQALAFYYAPPACIRILDPVYDADLYRLPDRLQQVLAISNPSRVIFDQKAPAMPPASMGSEPKRRWCYYYEKAELARQKGEWESIPKLFQQAKDQGFNSLASDPTEFLPFIEGYTRNSKWDDAYDLTLSTYEKAPEARPALCSIWRRTEQAMPISGHRDQVLDQVYHLLNCPIP